MNDYYQNNELGPRFNPVFVTDEDTNYGQTQDLAFTKKPVEIAIDDFFNFDDEIIYDNRPKNYPQHMPSSKKLDNERKAKLIKDAHDRKNYIDSKKKKDTKYNPHQRVETNWDNRVEPRGDFFDPTIKKKEIFTYKNKKQVQGQTPQIQRNMEEPEMDDEVERFLENKNKQLLKKAKLVNEQRIDQLESILNAEKERTGNQEKNFDKKYNDLLKMQKSMSHQQNFGKKPSRNSSTRIKERPSSTKKNKKKAQKKKFRPSTSNNIVGSYKTRDSDQNPYTNYEKPYIDYETDDIPFYDRLEYLKERTKEQLPEYRPSSKKQSPEVYRPRNSYSNERPSYNTQTEVHDLYKQKPQLQDEKKVTFNNHVNVSKEKTHTLKKLDVLNSQLNALKQELNPNNTIPKDDKKWYNQPSKNNYKSKGPMQGNIF